MSRYFLLLLLPLFVYANPAWFYNLECEKYEVLGYGVDTTLDKAKENALKDLSSTLSVKIESSTDISKVRTDDSYKVRASIDLKTTSDAVLSGVEFFKVQQQDDRWYVAAKYDNSPLESKVKKALFATKISDEKQNVYLQHTPLFKTLNESLAKHLDYKLVRKNNLWQLQYRHLLFPLATEELTKLFTSHKSSTISLKANQSVYKADDEIFFDIKHKEQGYISIFYVEHNGKVGVLASNVFSKKSLSFPDLKSSEAFVVANPYKKSINELYLAVYSKEPLHIDGLEAVTSNLLDESNYNFHTLVKALDDYPFSTFLIKIK